MWFDRYFRLLIIFKWTYQTYVFEIKIFVRVLLVKNRNIARFEKYFIFCIKYLFGLKHRIAYHLISIESMKNESLDVWIHCTLSVLQFVNNYHIQLALFICYICINLDLFFRMNCIAICITNFIGSQKSSSI